MRESVPELRFPEFKDDWKRTTLDNVGSLTSGGTPSRTNISYWKGEIPWVTTGEIGQRLILETAEAITEEGLKNSSAKLFDPETILMAMYGQGKTRGQVSLLGIKAATNQACAAVLVYKNHDPTFHFYYLFGQYEQLRNLSNDGSQKNLSLSLLKSFQVPFAELLEQQKIASFLSAVDEKIRLLGRRLELLQTYKRGVMQKLFSQEVRFKREDGSSFPDWEYVKFGDVFDFYRTNSLSRAQLTYETGNTQNIHYGDIHTKFSARFKQGHENIPYIDESEIVYLFSADEYCQIGDLVIADASEDYKDIGKAIEIVSKTETPLVAGLHTFLTRPRESTFAVGFAGYLMQAEHIRKEIMRLAQGISVLGISKTQLSKVVVPQPYLEEQQKIAAFLSAIDTKLDAVNAQISQTQRFKKGLLQQMFV